jgi:alpha-L-rhamnosidase
MSGHVQYTAPYIRSGGGPGGWGCAIIEVPYQFYRQYGETAPLKELYPQMRRYLQYLEDHSVNELVVSDKKGEWCLGDWCTPIQVILPAPFINNYYYIKSLKRLVEIARVIGREADIPAYEAKMDLRLKATQAAYFNSWDSNFIGNLQGANAFAIDLGLGNARTYQNLVKYYRELGCFDTGIFGTDVVTRVLFEHGAGDVAAALLMSEKEISFGGQRLRGATSLWEYWPRGRSHSHPMFGSVASYLFEYLLGIRQTDDSVAYRKVCIEPVLADGANRMAGSLLTEAGTIAVAYEKDAGSVHFTVQIPEGCEATMKLNGETVDLPAGTSEWTFAIA